MWVQCQLECELSKALGLDVQIFGTEIQNGEIPVYCTHFFKGFWSYIYSHSIFSSKEIVCDMWTWWFYFHDFLLFLVIICLGAWNVWHVAPWPYCQWVSFPLHCPINSGGVSVTIALSLRIQHIHPTLTSNFFHLRYFYLWLLASQIHWPLFVLLCLQIYPISLEASIHKSYVFDNTLNSLASFLFCHNNPAKPQPWIDPAICPLSNALGQPRAIEKILTIQQPDHKSK